MDTGYKWILFFTLVSVVTAEPMQEVASSSTSFTMKMYDFIRIKKGNLFISPFSCHTVLSMLYPGAGGNTQKEMKQALFPGSSMTDTDIYTGYSKIINLLKANSSEMQLSIANKIFMSQKYELKPAYKQTVQQYFYSDIMGIDFTQTETARTTINNWVEEKTNKKITNLIPPGALTAGTLTVLVNALYFKGVWKTKFEKNATVPQTFHGENGDTMVDMMHLKTNFSYTYVNDPRFTAQILEMSYQGSPDIAMFIVLPGSGTSLETIEKYLPIIETKTKDMYSTEVVVSLPKFKVEYSVDLTDYLKKMNMKSMFDNANFSALSTEPTAAVSAVLQKAFVEVNEEGAEAAAATAVISRKLSTGGDDRKPTFTADHPFVFFLQEKSSGTILFIGRFSNA